MFVFAFIGKNILRKRLQYLFHQFAHAVTVRGGDRDRIAQAEFVEFGRGGFRIHALGFIRRDPDALLQAPQLFRDHAVAGRQPRSRVGDQDHRIGLDDRLLGLARHLHVDAVVRIGLQPAGVDDDAGTAAKQAFAVVAVAGDAGDIDHDRVAPPGQAVEQRALADIRPPDQRDDRFHCRVSAYSPPLWVCTSKPSGSLMGVARSGLPSVAKRARKAPDSRATKWT